MPRRTYAIYSLVYRTMQVGLLGLLMAVANYPHALTGSVGTAAPEITGQIWLNASPQRIGEGGYPQTEQWIQSLLAER
jgi:hypothetical protein